MARGINKVILIGNLGADPEVRYTPTNTAIATVNVATTTGWKDKQSGEMQERTEWHRVVFFNRLAEIASQYLRKGAKVYIEGSLRTNKWTDKNNIERYTTEIMANEMQMLDARSGNAPQNSSPSDQRNENMAPSQPQPAATGGAHHDFDDTIPF